MYHFLFTALNFQITITLTNLEKFNKFRILVKDDWYTKVENISGKKKN